MVKKGSKNPSDKPPYPNNLLRLMARDNVTPSQIAKAWGVTAGDVSQRVNGRVQITAPRRDILTSSFGWSASDIYDDKSIEEQPRKKLPSPRLHAKQTATENAIFSILQGFVTLLTTKRLIQESDLVAVLSQQTKHFRLFDHPAEAEVIERFLGSLSSTAQEL